MFLERTVTFSSAFISFEGFQLANSEMPIGIDKSIDLIGRRFVDENFIQDF